MPINDLFGTSTPEYRQQPSNPRPGTQPSGLFTWFRSLLRTATPEYKRLPATSKATEQPEK